MAARDLKARGLLTATLVVATTMSNMALRQRSTVAAFVCCARRSATATSSNRCSSTMRRWEASNPATSCASSGHHRRRSAHRARRPRPHRPNQQIIDELTADLKVFPQVIVNIKVRERTPLESIPAVAAAIRAAERGVEGHRPRGYRYSAPNPGRVMIEAESEEAMRRHAAAIADAIRDELGV